MLWTLTCLKALARGAYAERRVAELNDTILRDIGVRRTDLYAPGQLHASRIRAARFRLRDVALLLLARECPCSALPTCR